MLAVPIDMGACVEYIKHLRRHMGSYARRLPRLADGSSPSWNVRKASRRRVHGKGLVGVRWIQAPGKKGSCQLPHLEESRTSLEVSQHHGIAGNATDIAELQ